MTPHPVFLDLDPDPRARADAYRAWLYEPIDPEEQRAIRAHLAQERALGEPRFQAMIEKTLNRPACVRRPGRQPPPRCSESGQLPLCPLTP